jgi:abequosyltransferase
MPSTSIIVPLLTIIVPTYNRCASLELLLRSLRAEVAPLGPDIVVYVSDNASTDDTPVMIKRLGAEWSELVSFRHDSNQGPERNFSHCVGQVHSRWFWIVSDDDLPKHGVVPKLLEVLRQHEPSLLYMQSEWTKPVTSSTQGEAVHRLRIMEMEADVFAGRVHAWFTFISGMVIDKWKLDAVLDGEPMDRFTGTNLVQLGWVLPLLTTTGPFIFVHDRCVLATKDNSGGYGLLTVFGVNFARIVNEILGLQSGLSRIIIGANIIHYLPGLIWYGRSTTGSSTHINENPWPEMSRQLGSYWLYWILLVPLGRFPRIFGQPLFQIWRVCTRLQREWRERFMTVVSVRRKP